MRKLNIEERVDIQWVPPQEMPSLLHRAELMLHACVGGLDKIVLEAMSSGCPVVSSSRAATEELADSCVATEEKLGVTAVALLAMKEEELQKLLRIHRKRVEENHSLPQLIKKICGEMK
jgi:glycosyltransferase involved in cell wall biosynthesis